MSELRDQLVQLRQARAAPRRVVSFLYGLKEAESVSIADVHEQAVAALAQLAERDPRLKPFQETLISDSAGDFDRELQTADVNAKLDASIADFLRFLSPYFMLPPAHVVLEFLVRRYKCVCHTCRDASIRRARGRRTSHAPAAPSPQRLALQRRRCHGLHPSVPRDHVLRAHGADSGHQVRGLAGPGAPPRAALTSLGRRLGDAATASGSSCARPRRRARR